RTDAAIKSAGNVTRVPVQQQQQSRAHQHPQALVLPSASNYILLSQHPQFLQLAPRPLHPQPQQLAQPSSSLSQSSTGNLVAMETGLAGSPGSRQASMTRRATQTDSERSARLSELTELRRLLGKELRHAEARLSAAWQARRFSGVPAVAPTGASVGAAAAASCGSNSGAQAAGFSPPSSPPPLARQHGAMGGREDRELLAVCQELSRLHQLVQRAERLRNAALPAGVHSALDRLSEAVRKCQTRRKEEVTSLNNRGSSSGGGRAVEERDSRAVSAAVGELLEQLQAARTCLVGDPADGRWPGRRSRPRWPTAAETAALRPELWPGSHGNPASHTRHHHRLRGPTANSEPLQRCLWPLLAGDVFGPGRPVRLRLCDPAGLPPAGTWRPACWTPAWRPDPATACWHGQPVGWAGGRRLLPAAAGRPGLGGGAPLCRQLRLRAGQARLVALLSGGGGRGDEAEKLAELRRCGLPVSELSECPGGRRGLADCQRLCRLLSELEARPGQAVRGAAACSGTAAAPSSHMSCILTDTNQGPLSSRRTLAHRRSDILANLCRSSIQSPVHRTPLLLTAPRPPDGGARAAAPLPAGPRYAALGVAADATDAELKAAFVRLAKLHHPDAAGDGGSTAKFIEAQDAYALAARHRRQSGSGGLTEEFSVEAATEEALGRFDIRHTAPQHRQYLEFDGIGSGTPSERQRQREQWRVHRAVENVREFRIARLQQEAAAASGTAVATAAPSLKSSERRSAKNFRTHSLIDRLVEDLIQDSVSRGELQSCRYFGKPLPDRTAGGNADPFADSMTHKLNSILASNGYEPDWLLLDKAVRAGAAEIRNRLTDARSRLGRWPFSEADSAAWERALADCAATVSELNQQVDQLNLTVPTLQQQRCHYRLDSLARPIAQDNSLAHSWRPPVRPQQQRQRLELDAFSTADLFSLSTLRQAWADLRDALKAYMCIGFYSNSQEQVIILMLGFGIQDLTNAWLLFTRSSPSQGPP
uniref:J domain-containing protein n=1 Tax=Macrostomum lignano TaxID=282301 RepID=A0A1I8FU64_9PLAT